jgi:hypothetical protein
MSFIAHNNIQKLQLQLQSKTQNILKGNLFLAYVCGTPTVKQEILETIGSLIYLASFKCSHTLFPLNRK